ncbi:MAG: histidine triad family protein [Chloroflexota bacterium]|jgi:histidine triad (HIT) family protein|nr:histidine triad family protein [Chloroflexota bacterium]
MSSTCLFCRIAAGELPANVIHRDERVIAFLDRSPLFLGHTLVVPRAHVDTLDDLDPEMVGPLFEVVRRTSVAVQRAMRADGSFVAVNTRVSQSVPHLHVHVVPRTEGDGFFSPRPIWKRRSYADEADAAGHAARIRAAYEAASG